MSMISIVSLGISGVFLLAGAVLFVLSYRNVSRQMSAEDRKQSTMDDQSDRILWEMGRGLPLVDSQPGGKTLTRRGFIPRFALGILAALAGWSAARVWADTRSLPQTVGCGADGSASRMETGANTLIAANGQQDHNDSHNDFETHGDNMTPHQDTYPRPGVHFDVPHYDEDTGHFDLHNDS